MWHTFLESKAGTILMLYLGLILFAVAVVVAAVYLPNNDKVYVFLSGIAGSFSGALFMYLQFKGKDDGPRPPNGV
jgi:presenilin-like A22 family membrane protease